MCYFQSNVARSLNRLHRRTGKFRAREFDDIIVYGENEFFDRFACTALKAVKSGLVATLQGCPIYQLESQSGLA